MLDNFSKSTEKPSAPVVNGDAKIQAPAESDRGQGIKESALITPEDNKIVVDSRKNAESNELHAVEIGGVPAQSDKQTIWHVVSGYHPNPLHGLIRPNPVALPVPPHQEAPPPPEVPPIPGAHEHGDNHSESGSDVDDNDIVFFDRNDPFWDQFDEDHAPHRPHLRDISGNRNPPTSSPPAEGRENRPPRPEAGGDGDL